MELEYNLQKEDYVNHLLFVFSYSKRIRNSRLRKWLGVTAFYLVLGIIGFIITDFLFFILFVCMILLCFFVCPVYLRWCGIKGLL